MCGLESASRAPSSWLWRERRAGGGEGDRERGRGGLSAPAESTQRRDIGQKGERFTAVATPPAL